MQPVFKVGSKDFTNYVKLSGLGWERNDVESPKSGRTMDAVMHSKRLAQKRKLTITCRELSYPEIHALSIAVNPEFIDVTFLDPALGVVTKKFYGTSISATTEGTRNGVVYFSDTKFEIVER